METRRAQERRTARNLSAGNSTAADSVVLVRLVSPEVFSAAINRSRQKPSSTSPRSYAKLAPQLCPNLYHYSQLVCNSVQRIFSIFRMFLALNVVIQCRNALAELNRVAPTGCSVATPCTQNNIAVYLYTHADARRYTSPYTYVFSFIT